MKTIAAILALSCIAAGSAFAANAEIDAAVKVFNDVQNDPEKLKTFCAMAKVMDETGDDEAKAEAAEKEIDGYITKLGPDFETAWNAGGDLPEDSPEMKKLDDAYDAVESKCAD